MLPLGPTNDDYQDHDSIFLFWVLSCCYSFSYMQLPITNSTHISTYASQQCNIMFSRCADDIVGLLNMSSSNNICRYLEYKNNIEKNQVCPIS